ncbi:MAG TPA: lamin tail domain-containing protein [Pyrinomonadaceae bacterium]|nr:lamin tail domain-containing protein [Pyrinomonadaceae bacterium]
MKNYTRWMLLAGVAVVLSLLALNFKSATSAQERGKTSKANDAVSTGAQKGGTAQNAPTKRLRNLNRKPDAAKENDPDLPAFQRGKVNFEAYLQKRQEHINMLLGVSEDGTYDSMLRVKAIGQMVQQESKLQKDAKNGLLAQPMISSTSWTPIGPQPIPNGQTANVVHPVSGRTTAIAVHPTNPDIVFISSANGGVFRSLNGGQTWTPIFDSAESLAIGALAFAPSDPTILYVGTGESNQCGSGCYAGIGVYRINNALTTADLTGPINPAYNFMTPGPTPTAVSTSTFSGRAISDILVHPTDPATIFVSTTSAIVGNPQQTPQGGTIPPLGIRGLYRSTNATAAAGTVAFQKLLVAPENCFDSPCTGNHNITGIRFDPGDPNVLVAFVRPGSTAGAALGGVWRTADALAATPTFTQRLALNTTRGEFSATRIGSVTTFYLASSESAAGTSCTTNSGAVRKSIDGGLTWVKQLGGGGFCGGQCSYDISIESDPSDPNIVHLGGSALSTSNPCSRIQARSTDGGASFARNDTGLHADTHVTVVSRSNPNIVYTGSDGGIWRSTNKGVTWTSLNNPGYSATQFQGLDVHATDRFFTLGGTQDNGTQFLLPTDNADPNKPINQWRRADFGDGGYALIDKSTTDTTNVTMYHTYFNQQNTLIGFGRVSRTDCAFEGEWVLKGNINNQVFGGFVNACGDVEGPNGITNDNVLFYAPMDLGPSLIPGQPNTFYFATDRLYRSINRGDTMTVASQAPVNPFPAAPSVGAAISSVWVSKTDDNARIVGTAVQSANTTAGLQTVGGQVFATRSGSNVLTEVTPPISVANRRAVGRVFIDPTNSSVAYVCYGGQGIPAVEHIWKTTNLSDTPGATTWTAIANGIPDVPVNAFVVDPADPTHLYAGTDIGVYTSQDGGATWVPYGTGLPRLAVFQMVIQDANRFLRIATHSRGMWEIALTPPSALTISGNVTGLAAGETATVRLTGSTTQAQVATGPTGAYSFTGLQAGGNYTVRPTRAGTRFAPAYRTYTDVPNSQSGQDFAASANTAATTATPGQVIISEFRLRGTSGATDEFIELYNNTGADITVNAGDGTEGWAIDATSGGTAENVAVIPNGTVIPARKHFLLAAGGYSLVRYAAADFYYRPITGTDIDDDGGLALYSTTDRGTFAPGNRLDAVGFTGNAANRLEGAGLAPIGSTDGEISFVRKLASGVPQDTNANNQDFVFVSTGTASFGAAQPILGAPGPQNTVSPRQDTARNITVTMFDPSVASSASPNRSRDGSNIGVNRSFGTMTIRRRFTNDSGQTITRIRFRVVDITTNPAPAGFADLRVLDSSDQLVPTAANASARVRGTLIEQLPMQQPNGGGYNTTLTLVNAQFPAGLESTVAGICAPTSTCSVDVQFMLGVDKEGAFRFIVSLEGLP